jgi:hypothetical protein
VRHQKLAKTDVIQNAQQTEMEWEAIKNNLNTKVDNFFKA